MVGGMKNPRLYSSGFDKFAGSEFEQRSWPEGLGAGKHRVIPSPPYSKRLSEKSGGLFYCRSFME